MAPQHQKVREFVRSHPRGVLATISPALTPHVAAVYIHIDEELYCYCVTKMATRKHRNIENNNAVTLAFVDDATLTHLEIVGKARVVSEPEKIASLIGALEVIIEGQQQEYWVPPIAQLSAGQYVFFEIRPLEIRYTNFAKTSDSTKALNERFEIVL